MKNFAAVAILACAVTAETDLCKAFKSTNDVNYTCNADGCKAKDQANTVFKNAEASVTEAYKIACDSAVTNMAAIGALAAAAAALAF